MLWLFGEIWLWLLLAFLLGAALAVAALSVARRSGSSRSGTAPDGADETATTHLPRVSDPERTQQIQRAEPQLHFGERPSPSPRPQPSPTPRRGPEPTWAAESPPPEDVPDEGRRHGVLPVPPSEWHVRNEWPDERDIAVAEEDRPRRDS